MRDTLNKSLEILIWISTGFLVLISCYSGAMIIRYGGLIPGSETWAIIGGFLTIIFGVTTSFVFAGLCFQVMDIRNFTKHMAMGIKRLQK
ncbi:hypothetical protein [Litoreibacter roseus]|uniref:Lipoprotein n=1 Tax=Litoreibacter roseus TaxID=2601869 RepID=A0A6N6JCN7_9RHOB|nr:hypothetical protein [Litoreibacter roseus]GFE64093.1 hypothetical protein KIN_11670 [Litoreibacter roseus]